MIESLRTSKEIIEIPGKLRIGVDFDNVIVSTGLKIREFVKENFGIDLTEIEKKKTRTEYWLQNWLEVKDRPDILSEVQRMFDDPDFHLGIKPIDGATETLNKWRHDGHDVLIITARSHPAVQEVTVKEIVDLGLDWVNKEGRLLFCEAGVDRTVAKPQIARRYGLHLFIEDHAETLREITSSSLMRKIIVDFDYKYNRHLDLGSKTTRCYNWEEIDQVVSACASRHYFIHSRKRNRF